MSNIKYWQEIAVLYHLFRSILRAKEDSRFSDEVNFAKEETILAQSLRYLHASQVCVVLEYQHVDNDLRVQIRAKFRADCTDREYS